jgi:hypothetical protein
MTTEELDALAHAKDVAAIANALFAIKGGDRRRIVVSMLSLSNVLLADDLVGRIALAQLMCEAAAELLRDLPLEQRMTVVTKWLN